MSLWVLDQSKKYADNAVETYENMQGYIYGLTLSNNSVDADNDIDIAIGRARADGNDYTMVLASAITKRSDAAWAVGTGNGGMDTGTKPNDGTLHVFLIRRSDTGVVDALFSISATAPTMPANYDQKRRIGAVLTGATTAPIIPFIQNEDLFEMSQTEDLNTLSPASTYTAVALTVPTGLNLTPIFLIGVFQELSDNTVFAGLISGNSNSTGSKTLVWADVGKAGGFIGNVITILTTNTNGQIKYYTTRATQVRIFTSGWIDTRGRLG